MEKLAINGREPVRKTKIYYGHQWIDEEDIKAVDDVLRSDFLGDVTPSSTRETKRARQ